MNNNVATASGSGELPDARLPIFVQTKEDATTQHVATILNIVHMMRSFLMVPEEGLQPLDENSKLTAQATLINACGRLDAILNDGERWSIGQLNRLQDAIASVHKTQEKVLKANLAYIEMNQRPSYQLKQTLATYNDQYFIAFWGKLDEPGMAIIGRGRTPSEALKDFDAAFHRTPRQQFTAIAESMRDPLPPSLPNDNNTPPNES